MLTDPEKMRVGLEQFASNPMLAGMAESMPELKAVLDNPALMEESIAQAQKLFSGMAEGGLGGLGGLSNEKLQEAMKLMGGGGDDMAGSIQEALKMTGWTAQSLRIPRTNSKSVEAHSRTPPTLLFTLLSLAVAPAHRRRRSPGQTRANAAAHAAGTLETHQARPRRGAGVSSQQNVPTRGSIPALRSCADSNCFGVLFIDSSSAHAPRTHARYAALHKTRSTSPQRIGVELHERARGQAKHGSTIIRCERERAP